MAVNLHVMCGIAGAGKSTWVGEEIHRLRAEGRAPSIVSRDAIRFSILDLNNSEDYFGFETQVFDEFIEAIQASITQGYSDVFADATHLNWRARRRLLERVQIPEGSVITFEVFDCNPIIAIQRNSNRSGRERVPESAIRNMARSFRAPDRFEIEELTRELGLKNEFVTILHKVGEK